MFGHKWQRLIENLILDLPVRARLRPLAAECAREQGHTCTIILISVMDNSTSGLKIYNGRQPKTVGVILVEECDAVTDDD